MIKTLYYCSFYHYTLSEVGLHHHNGGGAGFIGGMGHKGLLWGDGGVVGAVYVGSCFPSLTISLKVQYETGGTA